MKFFVVDDSDALRAVLRSRLEALPRASVVGEATNADDAISGILEARPDVVTLDFRLATGTCLRVIRAVKRSSPDTTIVVLTNHPEDAYRRRCVGLGCDYFFDKSVEFEEAIRLCAALAGNADAPATGEYP